MESRYDWFPRDTGRIRDEGARARSGGCRVGAGVRDLSAKPACRAVRLGIGDGARARARGGVGARDGRGSREPREIRADRGGFAHLRANHASRGEGGVVVGAPRSTMPSGAAPPGCSSCPPPPRRRRLRAGAVRAHRAHVARRRSAACSADLTPSSVLRRRRRPLWSRRPREALSASVEARRVRAEGRLRAGPRETRAGCRATRRASPRLRANYLTRSRRRPRTSSRRRTPRAPRCLTSTRTGRRRLRCQTRSPRSSAFLRSDSSAGTPRLRFAQTFHVRRAIFFTDCLLV